MSTQTSLPPVQTQSQVPFPPEQTKPFSYFDGAKTVYADPLAVHRQLLIKTRGKPNELANKVYAVKPDTTDVEKLQESWEAAEQLCALVRDVFCMQPFNSQTGQGARDEHCWAVWETYCLYMLDLKKKADSLQTSAMPTAAQTDSVQPTNSTPA